jgi:hypothetical protein
VPLHCYDNQIKGRSCHEKICRHGGVRRGIRFRKSVVYRLSAALAAEAVAEAVAACAKQGYKVTATIIDTDGITQATLRGDGASMTTLGPLAIRPTRC